MQRFGRAPRDHTMQGVAILIVEPHWLYEEQLGLGEARRLRELKRKTGSASSDN